MVILSINGYPRNDEVIMYKNIEMSLNNAELQKAVTDYLLSKGLIPQNTEINFQEVIIKDENHGNPKDVHVLRYTLNYRVDIPTE